MIVYDASGRQIQTVEGGSKEIRITLDAKGMFVVKAVSEGKEYTKKIIK
ncbi:T9SS type A sorting domain-containing protein [Chryseobacterium taihuense]